MGQGVGAEVGDFAHLFHYNIVLCRLALRHLLAGKVGQKHEQVVLLLAATVHLFFKGF